MAGEEYSTLWTVLSRVDHASLWKTIMTLVVGRGGQRLNFCSIHLEEVKEVEEQLWLLLRYFTAITLLKLQLFNVYHHRNDSG